MSRIFDIYVYYTTMVVIPIFNCRVNTFIALSIIKNRYALCIAAQRTIIMNVFSLKPSFSKIAPKSHFIYDYWGRVNNFLFKSNSSSHELFSSTPLDIVDTITFISVRRLLSVIYLRSSSIHSSNGIVFFLGLLCQ